MVLNSRSRSHVGKRVENERTVHDETDINFDPIFIFILYYFFFTMAAL